MAEKTTVVHCKRDEFDVYIGRPGKWGNPFVIGRDGDRAEVVKKYHRWVLQQPHLLADLHELQGKRLACWCAPEACHGDVLATLADGHATIAMPVSKARALMDYEVRICVAGSRSWHVPETFDLVLKKYLSWAAKDKDYTFISGDAWRGPDRMIVQWAEAHNVPCFKYPADWDQYGKRAGHIRNAEMRQSLTHLLAFWDGASRGTKEMIDNTKKLGDRSVFVVEVKPDHEWLARQRRKLTGL